MDGESLQGRDRDMTSARIISAGVLFFIIGTLAVAADEPRENRRGDSPRSAADRRFEQLDRNGDGFLDRSELPERMRNRFERFDRDGDGKISLEEFRRAMESRRRQSAGRTRQPERGGRPGEVNTPAARGERLRDRLEVGDAAPDFTLPLVAAEGTVTLASFRGERPVVLIFASYT
jgi:hypothetical protein